MREGFKKLKSRSEHGPDYIIILCVVFLVISGLFVLASASLNLGEIKFGDTYYYLKHQLLYGLIPGIIGFLLACRLNYRRYEKLAVFLLILNIAALFLVFTPMGLVSGGASRWLKLGPFNFQPSEILKCVFVIYLAAWLGFNSERRTNFLKGFLPFLMVVGLIAGLLLKQPATSMAVILVFTAFIIYFASGAKFSYIFGAGLLAVTGLTLIIVLTPYRFDRIMAYLNPETNLQTTGYHLDQALIAIGSGGLSGVGYGQSTTKIHYLPEPIGDSIFAVAAEEFGFIGAAILIIVFLIFILRILLLAKKTSDQFARLILIGFASVIAIQSFINIGAISGLIPLTGIPLPFISYGGTALMTFMTMSGIIVNISKNA